jgi:hypothetical protein
VTGKLTKSRCGEYSILADVGVFRLLKEKLGRKWRVGRLRKVERENRIYMSPAA